MCNLPRRLALELALRTFLQTDAPVVGVSLPMRRFAAVVFERGELAQRVDMAALAGTMRAESLLDPPIGLQRMVDELTRPRTYLFLSFEPAPYGAMSWAGMPCWPAVSW